MIESLKMSREENNQDIEVIDSLAKPAKEQAHYQTRVISSKEFAKGSKKLIVCFAGMFMAFGRIQPFEFLKYLTSIYNKQEIDFIFYIDKNQCWYHKGIKNITNNIEDTVTYLNNIIAKYEKVIFMGTSAGGYAAILFGSLCNVSHVVAFNPVTKLEKCINDQYSDLKNHMNNKTSYLLYGDVSLPENDIHHISQCDRLANEAGPHPNCFSDKRISSLSGLLNVVIVKKNELNLKVMRDNGELKTIIDLFK